MTHAESIAPVKANYNAPAVADIDDDLYDDNEPTTEELIERLRQSLRDVEAGRVHPTRELIAKMRARQAADANARS